MGRYRVQRLLGAGGMAKVYLCEDELLGINVALKCAGGHEREPSSSARLHGEAQVLAALDHPNVVRLLDSGEYDGRPFLVMEHVEGESLRAWLKTPRAWADVLAVLVRAGRGLAAVHAAGFLHRDFKPDNVLVGVNGAVKLADFGLAEHIDAEARPKTTPAAPSTTGALIGTPEYMSPEQILGAKLDARSDQFAYCMSIYEAIWGELPFDHLGVHMRAQVLDRAMARKPANRRDIYRVVRRGLERDGALRWPSVDALVDQLERILLTRRRTCVVRALCVGLGLRVNDE